MENFSANIMSFFTALILTAAGLVIAGGGLFFLGRFLLIWYKNRDREQVSLDSVLLQIALPRDNEIKIDTAEQLNLSIAFNCSAVYSRDIKATHNYLCTAL